MSLDLVRQRITGAPGTGAISLSGAAALPGYRTFSAAGAVNGRVYPIHVLDGTNWELSEASYASASGGSLTRPTTPVASSTGARLNLTDEAVVTVVPLAKDVFRGHAATVGNGTLLFFTINHGLGSRDVIVQAVSTTDPYANFGGVTFERATNDTVIARFTVAPAANAVRILIWRVA